MDIVLPGLSDDEILVRVAQCAAANLAAAKVEVADWHQQFSVFVDEFMQRPVVAAALANGPPPAEVREQIGRLLADQFTHVLSLQAAAVIQAHRETAARAVPPGIEVQRWSPDTCDCKLYRLLDVTNRNNVRTQTFSVRKGAEHRRLPIADLHNAVERENKLKNAFEGALDAATVGYEYKWSFDADRKLVVDISMLPMQTAMQVRTLLGRSEFNGKVILNG